MMFRSLQGRWRQSGETANGSSLILTVTLASSPNFFEQETTPNESFECTVETLKNLWILQDPKCTIPFVIQTSCTKYINLVGTNKWNVRSGKDTKIIAWTTALNNHKKKFNKLKSKVETGGIGSNSSNNDGSKKTDSSKNGKLKVPEWRIKFKGKTTTHNNEM